MGLPEKIWERMSGLREHHGAPPLTAGSVAGVAAPTTDGDSPEPDETAPAGGPPTGGYGLPNGRTPAPSSAAGTVQQPVDSVNGAVPRGLQVAASWSWRLILVAALVYGLGRIFGYLGEVTIPVAIAILLAAMLSPVAHRLRSWGIPLSGATAITVLGGLGLIVAALYLIISQIVSQASTLSSNVSSSFNTLTDYLQNGPLHVAAKYLSTDMYVQRIQAWLAASTSSLASYAAEVGSRLSQFIAGFAITLFSLFYFLYDGRGIFAFLLKLFPREVQARVDHAAGRGWRSLSHYVRATILVALSDAVGVLIGALLIGVPVAPALAALVFIGAFVPLVGAFVSGFVAVAVALVALGWVQALLMLGVIVFVLEVEGHILQPFLLGRAVKLHPLAVLLVIAVGIISGGIVGALIAVPILAFTKSFIQYLMGATDPQPTRLRWPARGSRPLRPAG